MVDRRRAPAKKTTPPRAGQPVRGSRTGRPIMALLDLLGRRWTLRVLWELRAEGATFRELRQRCDDVSPTVLSTRLSELRDAGILEHDAADGYVLSASGVTLLRLLAPLDRFAKSWAQGPGQ